MYTLADSGCKLLLFFGTKMCTGGKNIFFQPPFYDLAGLGGEMITVLDGNGSPLGKDLTYCVSSVALKLL